MLIIKLSYTASLKIKHFPGEAARPSTTMYDDTTENFPRVPRRPCSLQSVSKLYNYLHVCKNNYGKAALKGEIAQCKFFGRVSFGVNPVLWQKVWILYNTNRKIVFNIVVTYRDQEQIRSEAPIMESQRRTAWHPDAREAAVRATRSLQAETAAGGRRGDTQARPQHVPEQPDPWWPSQPQLCDTQRHEGTRNETPQRGECLWHQQHCHPIQHGCSHTSWEATVQGDCHTKVCGTWTYLLTSLR